ncbi:MAG TPA: PQQ-binding-like beta-propeller repeat protein, partial [Acidimicrobiales bacterium]|nr:PQQ-binding-like beta-propeller repeat protein [Acidimicrobiales bacterium]
MTAPGAVGWTSYRHDLSNTGEDPSSAVNAGDVAGVSVAWRKSGLTGVTSTPVVSNGVVYFGTEQGNEMAVDLSTGHTLWSVPVGGLVVGSPTIVGTAEYVGSGNILYRLDAATGAVVWKATTNPSKFAQINASPVVVANLVIEGTAQYEEIAGKPPLEFKGSIGAFDATTGKQVWNFVTTPADKTSGAGIGIWSTPAIDTGLGLLYVGTGQNIAQPPGKYEDSLLAINYQTGKLAWWSQFTTPDVFGVGNFTGKDADVGASPNLFSCHGEEIVGVGQKNGVYHALDAKTGETLWNTVLTHGSPFGGALGSAAFIDGRIIASSNIGDPKTYADT